MFPDSFSQLPGYIVNIPMVVSSDDEGSSSDEELDGNFDHECFDNPEDYIRLHPQKKSSKPLRGQILEVITPELSNKPQSKKIQAFWSKLQDENQKMEDPLLHRIRIVVGLNKMRSLSTSRNQSLERELNYGNGKTPIRKIGFLWDGRWEKKVGKKWVEVKYEYARKFYKQLKRYESERAYFFRENTEKALVGEKNPKKVKNLQIPYREIRDALKNHIATRVATNELRAQKINNVFLLFLDGDLQSFRSPKSIGPFATIDSLSKNPKLHIISTGYVVKAPQNKALELGVSADLAVRKATAKFIKNGVYYPEPCTAVKIREEFDTVTEDFSDGTSMYESPKEMPLLIGKVLRARKLNPKFCMEFDSSGAIVTETPSRMQRKFTSQINEEGKLISWGLSDFETMRGINQSHYNSRNWAQYLLLGIKLKTKIEFSGLMLQDRNSIRDCAVSLLSRLFNAYDPVEQSKGSSFQQEFISRLKNSNELVIDSIQPVTKIREHKGEKKEVKEKLWKELDAIDSLEKLKNAICRILQRPDDFSNIHSAAKEANKEIIKLFKETLSLDFEVVIKNTLLELESDSELPEFYYRIIRGEKFLKKDLQHGFFLSPLHIAAIAGNKEAIPQLVKWNENLSEVDSKGRYPFEYGLIYCRNNGLNLELLGALWCNNIFDIANKLVCESIPNISEQIQILEFLISKYGDGVICFYDTSLFFEAVYSGSNQLAELLAKYGQDIGKDLVNEVLSKAPNWNEHLRPLLKYINKKYLRRLRDELSEENNLHLDDFYRLYDPYEFKHFIIKNFDAKGIDQKELECEFFKALYNGEENQVEEFAARNDFSIPLAIQHELVRVKVWKKELELLARKYHECLNYTSLKIALGEDSYYSLIGMLREGAYLSSPGDRGYSDSSYDSDTYEYELSNLPDESSPDDPLNLIFSDDDVEMSEWLE